MAYMGGNALSASKLNTRLLEGQVIGGKYRVSHLLGEGGMASVWAGTNERTGKLVALKVIRPSVIATADAEAFLQSEGLAASRVNHPNVVTVFDVIEHEGMACIVMELLDGMPLGTYISLNGQLSLRDALGLLLPAMRGVAAAHAQGVIHRDLKPQNIFVCIGPDGRIITTKVLDFGISLMMDLVRGGPVAALPGLVGTPAYMSPEHIDGSTKIDERTDVYGFGLLLYEALTARMPFPGDPSTELLRRVLTESPVPLRELRPDLPRNIVAIIETAMSKNPDQRFASLNQMVAVIEDQLMPATLPPSATPSGGIPISSLSYTISGPLALSVPAYGAKDASGLHSATQIFGHSLRREDEAAVPNSEMLDDWSRRLVAVTKAPVPADAGALPVDHLRNGPSTVVSRRGIPGAMRMLRDWRVLSGVGLVLVAVLGVWTAARGGRGVKTVSSIQTAQASVPSISPIVVPTIVVPTAPVAQPAIPPTELQAVESQGEAHSAPAPVAAGGLGLVPSAGEPPQAGDRAAGVVPAHAKVRPVGDGVATGRPVAAHPRAVRSVAPRAGTLKLDDF